MIGDSVGPLLVEAAGGAGGSWCDGHCMSSARMSSHQEWGYFSIPAGGQRPH